MWESTGCKHTPYTSHSLTPHTLSQIHAHSDDVSALNIEGESSHMIYSAGDDGLCKVWLLKLWYVCDGV